MQNRCKPFTFHLQPFYKRIPADGFTFGFLKILNHQGKSKYFINNKIEKMKEKVQITWVTLAMILFCLLPGFSSKTYGQEKPGGVRIGIYDSRIAVFAWSRSDYFREFLAKFGEQSDSAQKAHDTARIKELSASAMSHQHLLHLTVFSNGSAGFVMKLINDKLPELAKTSGVSIIVCKWELNYHDPSFEIVDLTNEVVQLFQPKEDISKMGKDIMKEKPIPIDEFTIEAEMLDAYCRRFGNK
jgi:hypothetical protein